ncbi:hypothetical protein [Natronorubrum daqingense]|uniref:Uncharacterized protein n=1 Tax=Natronorubrum daqingense TaxID=588898 RepID=A0A1N6XZU8_9EURY|nr:hypothetical protein [Natronorubrum daqingense]APX95819.1 hypothetical protein BB347_03845 [Natronorubrum daqingense]SIR07870.1 hypothetical protein SAMN05421809_0270 [Natronorubrum daqingense]
MKTLEVTDEQYAVIQHLREAISEEVVGKYGFVRERDAVQFLIDNIDGEDELEIELEADLDSSATDDVAASVGAAIEGKSTPEDLEEVSYIEDDGDGDDEGSDEDGAGDAADEDVDEATDGAGDDEDENDSEDEVDAEDADGDEDDSESDSGEASASGGSADDDDMLDEMMSLLETHDDKWEESSSADFRYSVELPDGTTEDVQTKDDVRAILFKNYR